MFSQFIRRAGVVALVGFLLAVDGGAMAAGTRDDGAVSLEQQIRRQVREGKIRYQHCISDSVVETGEQPRIVFHNTCDQVVSVELCARRPTELGPNHFFFIIYGQSKSNFRLWFKSGQKFHYTYNTCGAAYCTPPDSDC